MRLPAAALAVLLAPSCGYHSGMVLPETSDSVAVEFFGNDTIVRDIESVGGGLNLFHFPVLLIPSAAHLQMWKDLTTGAGIQFSDRGAHALKGLDGDWRLYRVVDA